MPIETVKPIPQPLDIPALEAKFRELTHLMYDTSVPLAVLEDRVTPLLASDIKFVDGILTASGRDRFRTGLRGFHCVFYFDFDIFQLNVQLNDNAAESERRGRVIVDGVMNLRTIPFYTYPLRTILIYEFTIGQDGQDGQDLRITRLEEMWSFADLFANAPLIGKLYNASRSVAGYFFTGFFWLGTTLRRGQAVASRRPG